MGEENIEVVEVSDTEIEDDGTIVGEDMIAAVDTETGEALVDDVVVVETPDGVVIAEETISVVDADGDVEVLSDEVIVEE